MVWTVSQSLKTSSRRRMVLTLSSFAQITSLVTLSTRLVSCTSAQPRVKLLSVTTMVTSSTTLKIHLSVIELIAFSQLLVVWSSVVLTVSFGLLKISRLSMGHLMRFSNLRSASTTNNRTVMKLTGLQVCVWVNLKIKSTLLIATTSSKLSSSATTANNHPPRFPRWNHCTLRSTRKRLQVWISVCVSSWLWRPPTVSSTSGTMQPKLLKFHTSAKIVKTLKQLASIPQVSTLLSLIKIRSSSWMSCQKELKSMVLVSSSKAAARFVSLTVVTCSQLQLVLALSTSTTSIPRSAHPTWCVKVTLIRCALSIGSMMIWVSHRAAWTVTVISMTWPFKKKPRLGIASVTSTRRAWSSLVSPIFQDSLTTL